jgi:DNA-binding NtrC family response regulator
VRELQNVVERACALTEGERITSRDLPDYVLGGEASVRAPDTVTAVAMPEPRADLTLKDAKDRWMAVLEASYLRQVLARHDGNISAAAKAAGIDRKTFHRLINKHSLK